MRRWPIRAPNHCSVPGLFLHALYLVGPCESLLLKRSVVGPPKEDISATAEKAASPSLLLKRRVLPSPVLQRLEQVSMWFGCPARRLLGFQGEAAVSTFLVRLAVRTGSSGVASLVFAKTEGAAWGVELLTAATFHHSTTMALAVGSEPRERWFGIGCGGSGKRVAAFRTRAVLSHPPSSHT